MARRPLYLLRLEDRAVPAVLTVMNANDDGPGSLRGAVIAANDSIGVADLITFDPSFFAIPRTIVLTSGELTITDSVTIAGPAQTKLTIDGNNTDRVMEITGPDILNVNLSNLTITGGNSLSDGGGLFVDNEAVTLDRVVIAGNNANENQGGGIGVGNTTATLTIRNSTVTGNTATLGSGLYFYAGGGLLLENSTISGNIATGTDNNNGGGGLYFFGTVSPAGITIRNTTISGNTAQSGGGVVLKYLIGTATFQNSTITGNTALATATNLGNNQGYSYGFGGGGIAAIGGSGTVVLASTIVSGNAAGNGAADLAGSSTNITSTNVLAFSSAIGVAGGFNLSAASVNNLPYGADLKLGPLADNGGPTKTHALGSGSAAIDTGANPAALMTDARDTIRNVGSGVDIGAVERQTTPTVATVAVNDGTDQRSRLTSVAVTFSSAVILGANAFTLTRPAYGPTSPTAATLVSSPDVLAGNPGCGRINVSTTIDAAGHTVARLTFATNSGSANTIGQGVEASSLSDGSYVLSVNAAAVSSYDAFVMTADYQTNNTPESQYSAMGRIYRLQGDNDGDGDVDITDLGSFRQTFLAIANDPVNTPPYNASFDSDGDGDIDTTDLSGFRQRFTLIV